MIMMLSSVGHQGDGVRCRELGVASYLTKPVRQSLLLEAVLSVLATNERPLAHPVVVTRHTLNEAHRSLRILVAEDNAVNRQLVTALLGKRGHTIVTVVNGREAVAAVTKDVFDIVLMDVQMPEMDGLEATAAIPDNGGSDGRSRADHRVDGARDEGRSGDLRGGRHGRVSVEAHKPRSSCSR